MNNLNGILLVVASMAAFTMEDLFIKQLADTLAVGQILLFLGLGSGAIFAISARIGGHNLFAPQAWRGLFLLRALAEGLAAMAFATSLALVDISVVAAVFQATPLAITMGAALFLGENVGWRRWSAIGIGFLGVLLIIRPGLSGFEPAALLVVIAVIAVAARDLITQRIDRSVSSTVVSFQGFAALVVAGPALLLITGQGMSPVAPPEIARLVGGVIFGALGYYGIVAAMRIGEASALTPFRYTRLVFSILAGVVVFGERPDALMLLGAALIIGTGLFTVWREQRLLRRAGKDRAENC